MSKKHSKKIKKHIFTIDDMPMEYDFVLFGIQTSQKLYKLVYDLNKVFNFGLYRAEDLKLIRRDKEVSFEHYETQPNAIGQKMRLMNNEVLVPIAHPNTLFDTNEAFYLFPELPSLQFLLMMPKDSDLNFNFIQYTFDVPYPLRWIEVDLKKCATAFPVFPS